MCHLSNLDKVYFLLLSTYRVDKDAPAYAEPKFIVFYSMLVALFSSFCFKCKTGKPEVIMNKNGTLVTVTQNCGNCGDKSFQWRSQPLVLGKYPAGNILLSFANLMAGASISKLLLVFKHIGLCAYTSRTYFIHQNKFIFPLVLHYWESYRAILVNKLRSIQGAVWCGDGRFDSMGHSAKYGVYTMFCSTIMKVVHFELVQVSICIP